MISNRSKLMTILIAVALAAGMAACSNAVGGTGRLGLSLADASTDLYRAIYVSVAEVQVHFGEDPADMWTTVASPAKTYDLLSLVNGARESLGLADLSPGHYTQMRLILDDLPDDSLNILSQAHPYAQYVIDTSDQYHEMKVPSGLQSGVKIVQGFDINENSTTELILDFDASRSVVVAGRSGNYLLMPAIQILDLTLAAVVSGTVTNAADQTALESALVSAQSYDAAASDPKDQVVVRASTVSDLAGGYKIFVGGGTYGLVAAKDGFAPAAFEKVLADGATETQDFGLTATSAGTLTGTVAITGAGTETFATISIRKSVTFGAATVMIEVASVNIAEGGTYSLLLAPGAYTAVAWTAGKPTQAADVAIAAGGATTLNLSF